VKQTFKVTIDCDPAISEDVQTSGLLGAAPTALSILFAVFPSPCPWTALRASGLG
jgi:hypothetical protein